MGTRVTFVFGNPVDVDAFERDFPGHLARLRALPGVQRSESARVWPKEDGSPTPGHRIVDLWFADYDAASAAVASPEAADALPALLGSATGGFEGYFSDVESD